jgi:hypothetical protein
LFGAATIGMLVSVLVGEYQLVFARKLFINDEPIDFHDYSDDENNDTDSKDLSRDVTHQKYSKIEDPDARAIENARNENNLIESPLIPDTHIEIDANPPIQQNTTRIRFIIDYVDSENQEMSHDLVEKISAIVGDKQTSGDDISLNIISNGYTPEFSPFDVQFHLEPDENDEELTEITNGGGKSRGSVLKRFQRQSTATDEELNNSEINV